MRENRSPMLMCELFREFSKACGKNRHIGAVEVEAIAADANSSLNHVNAALKLDPLYSMFHICH